MVCEYLTNIVYLFVNRKGRLQDRGFSASGPPMGEAQEPAGYELRQVVAFYPPVLQEGYHEEDGEKPASRVPVLPPVLPVSRPAALRWEPPSCRSRSTRNVAVGKNSPIARLCGVVVFDSYFRMARWRVAPRVWPLAAVVRAHRPRLSNFIVRNGNVVCETLK